jgi:hypothetical protein
MPRKSVCACVCVRVFTPQTALPRKCVWGWVGVGVWVAGCVCVWVCVCVCVYATNGPAQEKRHISYINPSLSKRHIQYKDT